VLALLVSALGICWGKGHILSLLMQQNGPWSSGESNKSRAWLLSPGQHIFLSLKGLQIFLNLPPVQTVFFWLCVCVVGRNARKKINVINTYSKSKRFYLKPSRS
jgi:ABC-type amino acid transport system permease subunit